MSDSNDPIHIVVPEGQILDAQLFDFWPDGYLTRPIWFYEHNRRIKSAEKPSYVRMPDGLVPVFQLAQTRPITRKQSEFQTARTEFLRRFWFHSRHDVYLWISEEKASYIDVTARRQNGREVPWFSEQLVLEHLQGNEVYGLMAQKPSSKAAMTYWIAIDLDLHVETGGNLTLFQRQLQALLNCFWGKLNSQLVVSSTRANGVHLYFYFDKPKSLQRAQQLLKKDLDKLQSHNPDLAADVDAWNNGLKKAFPQKNWKVRQLDDLELYPANNKGFRFIGVAGKVVLADKVIGMTSWGEYTRGKKRGQPRQGFDLVSWWKSLNSTDRMSLNKVMDYVTSRLPDSNQQVKVILDSNGCTHPSTAIHAEAAEAKVIETTAPSARTPSKSSPTGFRGNTRKKLVEFWLGIDNPPKSFDPILLVTGRLLMQEGLTQDEAVTLINQFAKDLPEEARNCSSRLQPGKEVDLNRTIIKQINNAFTKPSAADPEAARKKLSETTLVWKKSGFRLSDKKTWHSTGKVQHEIDVHWTESDLRAFSVVLLPALKVKNLEIAKQVATEIVKLTEVKARRNHGWGYAFLKSWLPKQFGIACAKPKKQQDVLIALKRLKLIQEYGKAIPKQRPTIWHLGQRALARLDGDILTEFELNDPDCELSNLKFEEGMQLLAGCEEVLPQSLIKTRKSREENKGSI